MRTRTLVLALLVLIFAGGAAFLTHVWFNAQSDIATAPSAEPVPARAVLVARDALPMGHLIKPEDLVWQNWPDGDVNPAYVVRGTRAPADFAGAVIRTPVGKGEPVTDDRVVTPGDRGFLAAVLHPGMRAVSIAVDATSGISGFIYPGDHVDVLLTHILHPTDPEQRRASVTVIRNIQVIAIDQKASNKQDEPTVVHDVTVEVTPKQSELVAVANAMGKLSLSLTSISKESDEMAEDSAGSASMLMDRKHQSFTLDSEADHLLSPGGGPHVSVLHGAQTEEVAFGASK